MATDPRIEELGNLWAELPRAHQRAANLLRTEPPDHELKGEALARFIAADAAAGVIVKKIRQLQTQLGIQ